MSFSKLYSVIEERQERYLNDLFVFLRQKSISAQNIGIRDCADLLQSIMNAIGIETRLIETEGHPVVYGEMMNDPNAFTLLIYGHYDVQPADPIEEWLSSPFEPTIRDGRIYCRGAGDNKGQLMAQLMAVQTYLDVMGKLPINLKFVFEGEEESGSVNLPAFVKANRDLLKCELVYTSDGPMHESGAPFVLLGVRGMLYVELTARGAKWDNHSGNKGNIAPNPAWKLIDLLRTMREENGRVLIDGFYDQIRQPSETEIELLRKLPFDPSQIAKQIGLTSLDMDSETYYRKLTMEPTFNICGFHSGYGGEGSKTIIPALAQLKMDIRLVVDQDPDDIYKKFCRHVERVAPDVEVKHLGAMKPSRTSAELEVVQTITAAVREAYGQEPILQPSLGGSLPDYVWTELLGVPSIVVPYANADEANHSPNENMEIENYFNGIRCTCHVIDSLGRM